MGNRIKITNVISEICIQTDQQQTTEPNNSKKPKKKSKQPKSFQYSISKNHSGVDLIFSNSFMKNNPRIVFKRKSEAKPCFGMETLKNRKDNFSDDDLSIELSDEDDFISFNYVNSNDTVSLEKEACPIVPNLPVENVSKLMSFKNKPSNLKSQSVTEDMYNGTRMNMLLEQLGILLKTRERKKKITDNSEKLAPDTNSTPLEVPENLLKSTESSVINYRPMKQYNEVTNANTNCFLEDYYYSPFRPVRFTSSNQFYKKRILLENLTPIYQEASNFTQPSLVDNNENDQYGNENSNPLPPVRYKNAFTCCFDTKRDDVDQIENVAPLVTTSKLSVKKCFQSKLKSKSIDNFEKISKLKKIGVSILYTILFTIMFGAIVGPNIVCL